MSRLHATGAHTHAFLVNWPPNWFAWFSAQRTFSKLAHSRGESVKNIS